MFGDGRNWSARNGSGKGSDEDDDEDDDDEDEVDDGEDDVEGLVSLDDVSKCSKTANPNSSNNDRSDQSGGGLKNGTNKLGNGKPKHHSSFGKEFVLSTFIVQIEETDSRMLVWIFCSQFGKVLLIFLMGFRWNFVGQGWDGWPFRE